MPNLCQRENEDQNIKKNGTSCTKSKIGIVINAFFGIVRNPERLNRCATENAGNNLEL